MSDTLPTSSRLRRALVSAAGVLALALALGVGLADAPAATAWDPGHGDAALAPRTTFTMAPDGSSGATQGGEGIPNIDSVKKTIAT